MHLFRQKGKKKDSDELTFKISSPSNFQQKVHIEFDSNRGEFEGLPNDWTAVLQSSGITKEETKNDPETVLKVLQFHEQLTQGGEVAVLGEPVLSPSLSPPQSPVPQTSNTVPSPPPPPQTTATPTVSSATDSPTVNRKPPRKGTHPLPPSPALSPSTSRTPSPSPSLAPSDFSPAGIVSAAFLATSTTAATSSPNSSSFSPYSSSPSPTPPKPTPLTSTSTPTPSSPSASRPTPPTRPGMPIPSPSSSTATPPPVRPLPRAPTQAQVAPSSSVPTPSTPSPFKVPPSPAVSPTYASPSPLVHTPPAHASVTPPLPFPVSVPVPVSTAPAPPPSALPPPPQAHPHPQPTAGTPPTPSVLPPPPLPLAGRAPSIEDIVSKDNPNVIFTNLKLIGQGASGQVFQGIDCRTKKQVAIKKMVVSKQPNKKVIVNEIEIMRKCSCPSTVNFIESYLDEGVLWVVMEFVSGGALTDVVLHIKLREEQIALITRETLVGLAHLHKHRIIHRDIKVVTDYH